MNGSDLSLDTPWALGEKNYQKIQDVLDDQQVKQILELGSGISTVRLSLDYPNAFIISVEQSTEFRNRTLERLVKHGIENARVFFCPLKFTRFKLRFYYTYDITESILNHTYDLVLIDGPVESQTLRGREGILYRIFPSIKNEGLIVLDDYRRYGAQNTVKNWLKTYSTQLIIFKEYNDLIILKKIRYADSAIESLGATQLLDNWKSFLSLVIRKLYGKVKGFFENHI